MSLLSGLWEALGRLLAGLGVWMAGVWQGKTSARLGAAEAILEARSRADAIDDKVARANRTAVDDGLREFTRD